MISSDALSRDDLPRMYIAESLDFSLEFFLDHLGIINTRAPGDVVYYLIATILPCGVRTFLSYSSTELGATASPTPADILMPYCSSFINSVVREATGR